MNEKDTMSYMQCVNAYAEMSKKFKRLIKRVDEKLDELKVIKKQIKNLKSFQLDLMGILDSTKIMGDSMLMRIQSLEGERQE